MSDIDGDDSEDLVDDDYVLHITVENSERQVTDVPGLFGFFVALGFLVYFSIGPVRAHRNFWALGFPREMTGAHCGVNEHHDKPFLYLCPNSSGALSRHWSECREHCPTASGRRLLEASSDVHSTDTGSDSIPTELCGDVETEVFMGYVCEPSNDTLADEMYVYTGDYMPLVLFRMLTHNTFALLISALVSFILAVAFVAALEVCSGCLVWGTVGLVVLTTGIWALYLLIGCTYYDYCHDGERVGHGIGGLIMLSICIIVARATTRIAQDISLAVECIAWASHQLFDLPTMMCIPVLSLLLKMTLVAFMWRVFKHLLMNMDEGYIQFGDHVALVNKILFYFAGISFYWLQKTVSAYVTFITVYCSQMWYFKGGSHHKKYKGPPGLLRRAMWVALRYHLGTLFIAAIVVESFHPIRVIIRRFVDCDRFSLMAYAEVSRLSIPLFPASQMAGRRLQQTTSKPLAVLLGISNVFKFAGYGMCSFIGFFVIAVDYFVGSDTLVRSKPGYIPNRFVWFSCGAVVGLLVAVPFMDLFVSIAESILYCTCLTRQSEKLQEEQEEAEAAAELEKAGLSTNLADYARSRLCGYCAWRPKEIFVGEGRLEEKRPLQSAKDFLDESPHEWKTVSSP